VPSALRLALGAATLGLAACSFIPTYQRPEAPIAPTYPAETAPDSVAGGTAAADVDWQHFFADARLQRLIDLALVNNRDLRVAVLNIEQARAAYDIRRADLWPTVGAGITVERQPGTSASQFTTYAVGVAVSNWEVDLFGRVRAQSQAALSQYFATAEARKAVHISLVASVANAYLNVLADEELLRVTQQTL
jgi:outer membrane protein, multidrug efflux system